MENLYPLTAAQNMHYQWIKQYHTQQVSGVSMAAALKLDIDFVLLGKCINEETKRYECLNLRFTAPDEHDEIKQYLKRKVHRHFKILNLSSMSFEEAEEIMQSMAYETLDGNDRPMYEFLMVMLPDGFNGFFVHLDHRLIDSCGLAVMVKDIMSLYAHYKYGYEYPSALSDFEKMLNTDLEKAAKKFMTYSKEDEGALNVIKTELQSSKRFKRLSKIPMFNEMKDSIAEIGAKVNGLIFKEGMNAAYFPKANAIITPSKSLRTSIFHEMGHAMNANGGIILKSLQKMRPMASIVPAIVLADALLNKRKTTDEKLENNSVGNVIQNVRLGVKKHAGLISAAAMLPMVVEEGIASLRGQKLAKGLVKDGILSKDLFKKIKLTNLGGFTTYAATMVGIGLATKVAVDVKDTIQAKYEQKKLAKFQAKQEKIAARKAGK